MRKLWLLLPIASTYLLFYVIYEVFNEAMMHQWWFFPTWFLLLIGWLISFIGINFANGE